MANVKKKASKTTTSSVVKTRASKKDSIVSSNVASFVSQATYQQRVQEKAYELYLKRGGTPGQDLCDWFTAEKIVAAQIK